MAVTRPTTTTRTTTTTPGSPHVTRFVVLRATPCNVVVALLILGTDNSRRTMVLDINPTSSSSSSSSGFKRTIINPTTIPRARPPPQDDRHHHHRRDPPPLLFPPPLRRRTSTPTQGNLNQEIGTAVHNTTENIILLMVEGTVVVERRIGHRHRPHHRHHQDRMLVRLVLPVRLP
jgi:hypothetical protein